MALKLIDEGALDAVLNEAKSDLRRNPDVGGLREFIDFMVILKSKLQPLPESYSKEDLSRLLDRFQADLNYMGKLEMLNRDMLLKLQELLYEMRILTYPDQKQQPSAANPMLLGMEYHNPDTYENLERLQAHLTTLKK